MGKRGFTLIELVMIIVILGILVAAAIPKFVDLTTQAKISATKGGLAAMRATIAIQYAKNATSTSPPANLFPSAITTDLFADSRIPKNALNNSTSVAAVGATAAGTATSADGWWYISASGLAGAYSDGTNDTSGF